MGTLTDSCYIIYYANELLVRIRLSCLKLLQTRSFNMQKQCAKNFREKSNDGNRCR